MKRRWSIILGLAILVVAGLFLLFGGKSRAQRELEATRRSLRQQGFKIELRDFNFSLSPEQSARAALLGTTTRAAITNRTRPPLNAAEVRELLKPASTDTAVVLWQLEQMRSWRTDDLWSELRSQAVANSARLRTAREAALSGPIRFEPIDSQSPQALFPYLADLRTLENVFAGQTLLALHTGDQAEAWTNLLAATCLVTSYEPDPFEISHLVRFGNATAAYKTTWHALQRQDWTEAQLAELQRRWEAPDFWHGLPDTAAYARATAVGLCQWERKHLLWPQMTMSETLHYPRAAWSGLLYNLRQSSWRRVGSYEDERAVLLYYRDRELQVRRAVQASTWSEMRQLPGVTNLVPFVSTNRTRFSALMNQRQLIGVGQGGGSRLLGRAAETEARRRLLVTAIALERYRVRHGAYPQKLEALVPELLPKLPLDFMDGQPLRYRPTGDGHFVLYSVGLDCVDNGGKMEMPGPLPAPFPASEDFGLPPRTDLVWPRPASAAEVVRLQQQEKAEEEARDAELEGLRGSVWWNRTARRQTQVEQILAAAPAALTNEPRYRGRRLSEFLQNATATNRLTLQRLLSLQPVVTGEEPEVATFELPIQFDALTNVGQLTLCIDPVADDESEEGWQVAACECVRSTNGNCRLVWNTIYESPGKHAIAASLNLQETAATAEDVVGPFLPFVITNLCQFSPSSMFFKPDTGADFLAKLPESNATWQVELKAPTGERLRTLTGSTSNGVLMVHWDLTDDHGRACTNAAYGSVFHLTLPNSGRSQTLKGP